MDACGVFDRMKRRVKRIAGTVGQGLVEMALVLPIVLLLVFGVFELGRGVFIFSALNNASREAARYGTAAGQIPGTSGPRYLDCAAIRQAAIDTAFLSGLAEGGVQIAYDKPPDPASGNTDMVVYGYCNGNTAVFTDGVTALTTGDVAQGDRIVVTVTRDIDPILPLVPIPTFSPTFVTARTILKSITVGPLECSDNLDNDTDGLADYPDDPGCTSPDDTTESFCYRLSVTGRPIVAGNLAVDPGANCANRYIEQTPVELKAIPEAHYAFDYWEINGANVGSSPTTNLNIIADTEAIAHFHLKTTDLSLWKNSYPEPVGSGETLNYYLEVTNNGSITYTDTATSIVVTDTLPAEVSVIPDTLPAACTHSGEPTGGEVVCEFPPIDDGLNAYMEIQVTAPIVNLDTVITNTATVSGFEFDPDLTNNTSERPTTVIPLTDLVLHSKTSSPGPIYAGDHYTYTIEVGNNGPSVATGVVVTDTLEGGVSFVDPQPIPGPCSAVANEVTCDIGSLDVGATATVSFTVKAPDSGGDIQNVATVGGDQTDRNLGNNSNAPLGTTFVRHANMTIQKIDEVDPATRDQPFDYTLTVRNNGPSDAVNVVVSDTLPAGLVYNDDFSDPRCDLSGGTVTCLLGTMIKNQQEQLDLNVTPIVASPDPIINTAVVSSDTLDQNDNNEASDSTIVEATVALSVSKSASPDAVYPNEPVVFTIGVANSGPSIANNVTVVDTLPAGFTFDGTGSTDEDWSCDPYNATTRELRCTLATLDAFDGAADITIRATPTIDGTYTNKVAVTSDEESVATTGEAQVVVSPSVKLSLTKLGPATAVLNESFSYSLGVVNNGASTATNVTIVDTLPDGASLPVDALSSGCTQVSTQVVECVAAALAPDESAAFTIRVLPIQTGTLTNTAVVRATEYDLGPGEVTVVTEVSSARAPQALGDAPNTAWFSGRGNVNKMSLLLREHLL